LGTIGKCICYGTTAEPLQDEHVVPYGLNGPWILREASCPKCAAITSAFEGSVLRGFLREIRSALGFKTRRKKQQPKTFSLSVTRGEEEEKHRGELIARLQKTDKDAAARLLNRKAEEDKKQ